MLRHISGMMQKSHYLLPFVCGRFLKSCVTSRYGWMDPFQRAFLGNGSATKSCPILSNGGCVPARSAYVGTQCVAPCSKNSYNGLLGILFNAACGLSIKKDDAFVARKSTERVCRWVGHTVIAVHSGALHLSYASACL